MNDPKLSDGGGLAQPLRKGGGGEGGGSSGCDSPEPSLSAWFGVSGCWKGDAMSPKRIQLRRSKGWRLPPNTVVVSRPSKWGNPYRIGDEAPGLPGEKMDREDVVMWHRIGLINAPAEIIETIRRELRGKNLACWCPLGVECHADTLLEVANEDAHLSGDARNTPNEKGQP